MEPTQCHHLQLNKCKVGEQFFYKCALCKTNFVVPEPLQIKVTYPGKP
jgi:hypothetical protein